MKVFAIWLVCFAVMGHPVVAQSTKHTQTSEEILEVAALSLNEKLRVTVKIKGDPVQVERIGVGPKEMKRFSGTVIEIEQDHFVVADEVLVFGSIRVAVPFDKVASIKPQSRTLYGLRQAGEYTTASALVAFIVPGFFVCVASNGKLCTKWTSPR